MIQLFLAILLGLVVVSFLGFLDAIINNKKPLYRGVLTVLGIVFFVVAYAWAANQKISEQTADTTPTSDDLVITVDDPSGTPTNKKVTLDNLGKAITAGDFALTADADAGDYNIQSLDKLEGVDNTIYIDLGDADTLEIVSGATVEVSGTTIQLNAPITTVYGGTQYDPLTAVPTSPFINTIYWFDAVTADPAGVGGSDAYSAVTTAAGWVARYDANGNRFAQGIELPAYSHISGGDFPYAGTSGATTTLTAAECKAGIITNAGATADHWYQLPAISRGFNFSFRVVAAYRMFLVPDTGEQLRLNGELLDANHQIDNPYDMLGEVMYCEYTEVTDGAYQLNCDSGCTTFEELAD